MTKDEEVREAALAQAINLAKVQPSPTGDSVVANAEKFYEFLKGKGSE